MAQRHDVLRHEVLRHDVLRHDVLRRVLALVESAALFMTSPFSPLPAEPG